MATQTLNILTYYFVKTPKSEKKLAQTQFPTAKREGSSKTIKSSKLQIRKYIDKLSATHGYLLGGAQPVIPPNL